MKQSDRLLLQDTGPCPTTAPYCSQDHLLVKNKPERLGIRQANTRYGWLLIMGHLGVGLAPSADGMVIAVPRSHPHPTLLGSPRGGRPGIPTPAGLSVRGPPTSCRDRPQTVFRLFFFQWQTPSPSIINEKKSHQHGARC